MLRPAYLLSTVAIAALAAIQLQGAMLPTERSATTVLKQNHAPQVRLSAPVQIISNTELSKPIQSQRWVF